MHFHDVGLTTYRKTHEMRSECPKTAFLGTIRRVIDVCAMCYMAFLGFLRLLLRSQHVRTRVHTLSGLCRLALPLPHSRLNSVQRYDTKTILTNFCVKISQWNVFLGRRLRSLQGEAYANRSYPVHGLIFACLHAGWPPRHCLHTRHALLSRTAMLPHCEPSARDLTKFNTNHDFHPYFVKKCQRNTKKYNEKPLQCRHYNSWEPTNLLGFSMG